MFNSSQPQSAWHLAPLTKMLGDTIAKNIDLAGIKVFTIQELSKRKDNEILQQLSANRFFLTPDRSGLGQLCTDTSVLKINGEDWSTRNQDKDVFSAAFISEWGENIAEKIDGSYTQGAINLARSICQGSLPQISGTTIGILAPKTREMNLIINENEIGISLSFEDFSIQVTKNYILETIPLGGRIDCHFTLTTPDIRPGHLIMNKTPKFKLDYLAASGSVCQLLITDHNFQIIPKNIRYTLRCTPPEEKIVHNRWGTRSRYALESVDTSPPQETEQTSIVPSLGR